MLWIRTVFQFFIHTFHELHNYTRSNSKCLTFRCPKFKRAIKWRSNNVLRIRWYVNAHYFPIMSLQCFQWLPSLVGPDFDCIIITASNQKIPIIFLILYIRDQICMRWNCIDWLTTPQIPNLKRYNNMKSHRISSINGKHTTKSA